MDQLMNGKVGFSRAFWFCPLDCVAAQLTIPWKAALKTFHLGNEM